MTSRRERLRNLFGAAHVHRPSHAPHPPRASETRGFAAAGLFVRSPSLRAASEQDVLQDELPDDIEFLSLDNSPYDEPDTYEQDDLDTIDEDEHRRESGSSGRGSSRGDSVDDEDDDDMKEWPEDDASDAPDTAVHLDGVPRSDRRLTARHYKQCQFAKDLLHLLQYELRVPGWTSLPQEASSDHLSVYKVSGSLTNAVFFISYPQLDVSSSNADHSPENQRPEQPPTVLLRIYGPSSGNLVSRKKELHVLNTLSACYAIGPAILGTFTNGRVEEYFESRALLQDEMRDPRISRWIARRMRELHSVDLSLMELPADHPKSPFFGPRRLSTDMTRPGLSNVDSGLSAMSTSSASSIRSFSSSYSELSTSVPHSPALNARVSSRPGVSEGRAPRKKRSQSSIGSRADFSLEGEKFNKPRSVIWQNIDSWTKAAKRVLNKVDKLEDILQGIAGPNPDATRGGDFIYDVDPLNAPSLLAECRRLLDIQAFQQEVKKYRQYIQKREAQSGRSKRVFAHNDAQCGNLLKLTPGGKDEIVPGLKFPHEMIIVVDFEYAGVNPRAFDIANHFLEWQTDYHHPTLSHSLSRHGKAPTIEERQRFYRAYVPCDGAFDSGQEPPIPALEEDDPRVQRLEEEVQLWTAASHAMYTVWSVVQATDDIVRRIDEWLGDRKQAEAAEAKVQAYRENLRNKRAREQKEVESKGERNENKEVIGREGSASDDVANLKNGETGENQARGVELHTIGDFDYMSYALERATLFRQSIMQLGL